MKKAPGKTLVIGASYVALECAGFLTAFGYDTTVMIRSILLRGFNQDMANRIGNYMENYGTKFIKDSVLVKLEKPGEKIIVTSLTGVEQKSEEFDTVPFDIGRYALTSGVNLENAEVISEKNGKFKVNDVEQTNVPNIYAIGDVIYV